MRVSKIQIIREFLSKQKRKPINLPTIAHPNISIIVKKPLTIDAIPLIRIPYANNANNLTLINSLSAYSRN